jgi:hypothetical protein
MYAVHAEPDHAARQSYTKCEIIDGLALPRRVMGRALAVRPQRARHGDTVRGQSTLATVSCVRCGDFVRTRSAGHSNTRAHDEGDRFISSLTYSVVVSPQLDLSR